MGDEVNFLAWQLGRKNDPKDIPALREQRLLAGLADEDAVMDQTVDWDLNVNARNLRYTAVPTSQGDFGCRRDAFRAPFHGEAIELRAGKSVTVDKENEPWHGVLWYGSGTANGSLISAGGTFDGEFFVPPDTEVKLVADSAGDML